MRIAARWQRRRPGRPRRADPLRRGSRRRRAHPLHDLASGRVPRLAHRGLRDVPKLASFLHLPVQSGSDRVLTLMKRGYTVLEYKAEAAPAARTCAPASACPPTSSSGFRAKRSRTSRRRSTSCAKPASTRPSASSTARGPARPRLRCPTDHARGEAEAARAPAGAAQRAGARDQPRHGRHRATRAGRASGEEGRARARGPHREQPLGQFRRSAHVGQRFADVLVTEAMPNSLRGRLVARARSIA